MPVETINEASEAAAQEITEQVTLRDGTVITVGEMVVVDFIPLWKRLQGAIRAGVEAYRAWQKTNDLANLTGTIYQAGGVKTEIETGGGVQRNEVGPMSADQAAAVTSAAREDVQAAEANLSKWLEAALKHLEDAPDLLIDICAASTPKNADFWKKCKLGELLKAFRASYRVNFSENEDVLDFFGDTPLPFMRKRFGSQDEGNNQSSSNANQ